MIIVGDKELGIDMVLEEELEGVVGVPKSGRQTPEHRMLVQLLVLQPIGNFLLPAAA